MAKLSWPGGRPDEKRIARALFRETVVRARAPVFFARLAVADTIDGRFDLVALHAWLVLEWLKNVRPALSQLYINEVFFGFDEALRELGTGDIGMSRRLKALANAFYGRLHAYGGARDVVALTAAIHRNVYRGEAAKESAARKLATYAWAARSRLTGAPSDQQGPDFGPLPEIA